MKLLPDYLDPFIQYFQKELPKLAEAYSWKIPLSLKPFPGAGESGYQVNVALKQYFHQQWQQADHNSRLKLGHDIVVIWGQVKTNSLETIAAHVANASEKAPILNLAGIASLSKILAIADPDRYAIYDARVAACLNAVQFNSKATSPLAFRYIPGRNNVTGNSNTKRGLTQTPAFKRRALINNGWRDIPSADGYQTYLDTLQACLTHLPGYRLYDLEMSLFANAEIECQKAMDIINGMQS